MRYLECHFSTNDFEEQVHVNYMTHSAHIHIIYVSATKENVTSSYCQRSTLPGFIYVGMTPTMECDLLHPNVFHQLTENAVKALSRLLVWLL